MLSRVTEAAWNKNGPEPMDFFANIHVHDFKIHLANEIIKIIIIIMSAIIIIIQELLSTIILEASVSGHY